MAELASSLTDRYLAAQLAGNRRAGLDIVLNDGLAHGVPIPDLYLTVIEAAQHTIGQLWQENRITVAQEHLATAISHLALAHLYPSLPCEPTNGRQVLVACVAGEIHDLGARMCADFFEMAGFDVRYLGANVPTDSLVAMVRENPPDVLALSVTMTFNLPALHDAITLSREVAGSHMHVAVGGHALLWAPGLAASLGVEIADGDIRESVSTTQRILGLRAS